MKNTNKILVLLSALFPLVASEDEGAVPAGSSPAAAGVVGVEDDEGLSPQQQYRLNIVGQQLAARLRQQWMTLQANLRDIPRSDGARWNFQCVNPGMGSVHGRDRTARLLGLACALPTALRTASGAEPRGAQVVLARAARAIEDASRTFLNGAGGYPTLPEIFRSDVDARVAAEAAALRATLNFAENAAERATREEREALAAAEQATAEATDQARRDRVEQERVEAAMRASLSRGHAAGAGEEEAAGSLAVAGAEGSGSGGEGGGVRAPDLARVERLLPAGMASQDDLAEVARVEGAGAGLPPFTQAVIEAAIAGESEAIALMQAHAAKGSEAAQSLSEALGLSGRSVAPTPAPPVAVAAADDGAAGPGGALPPMSQALTEAALTGDHRAIEAIRHYAAEGNAAALRALDFLEPEGVAPTLAGSWDAPSVGGEASAGRAPAPMIDEALIQRALMGEVAAREIIRERAAGGDLAAIRALEFIS